MFSHCSFFTVIPVYIVGGAVVNKFVLKREYDNKLDYIPFASFWGNFFGLVKVSQHTITNILGRCSIYIRNHQR